MYLEEKLNIDRLSMQCLSKLFFYVLLHLGLTEGKNCFNHCLVLYGIYTRKDKNAPPTTTAPVTEQGRLVLTWIEKER